MRASLLALAKSIYYYFMKLCTAPFVNFSPKQRGNEARKDPLVQFVVFSNFWHICIDMT